jgi:hypothetical protein
VPIPFYDGDLAAQPVVEELMDDPQAAVNPFIQIWWKRQQDEKPGP